ncbi:hypothetical protein HQQ80_19755 [Microbacteriaceae bacterium VKM Ac-2855]|nr:hypothetical protein [Microbacteriaceae bacterium VKM Ac-2855]
MGHRGSIQDLPAPVSGVDLFLRAEGPPVISLFARPHLLTSLSTFTAGTPAQVSLSFTYLPLPDDLGNPVNLVTLTPQQADALDRAETSALPPWMIVDLRRLRYPAVDDAVRNHAAPAADTEMLLRSHLNRISARAPGDGVGAQDVAVTDLLVRLEGEPIRAQRIETNTLLALGFATQGRIVTTVLPRHLLPDIPLVYDRLA